VKTHTDTNLKTKHTHAHFSDVISKGDLCVLTEEFMKGSSSLMGTPAKKLLLKKEEEKKNLIRKIYFNLRQGCMIYSICLFE